MGGEKRQPIENGQTIPAVSSIHGKNSAEPGLKMKMKVSRQLKGFKIPQHWIFLMWSQPEDDLSVTEEDPMGPS